MSRGLCSCARPGGARCFGFYCRSMGLRTGSRHHWFWKGVYGPEIGLSWWISMEAMIQASLPDCCYPCPGRAAEAGLGGGAGAGAFYQTKLKCNFCCRRAKQGSEVVVIIRWSGFPIQADECESEVLRNGQPANERGTRRASQPLLTAPSLRTPTGRTAARERPSGITVRASRVRVKKRNLRCVPFKDGRAPRRRSVLPASSVPPTARRGSPITAKTRCCASQR